MIYNLTTREQNFFRGISANLDRIGIGRIFLERNTKEMTDNVFHSLEKLEEYKLISIVPNKHDRSQKNVMMGVMLTKEGYEFCEMLKSHEDL